MSDDEATAAADNAVRGVRRIFLVALAAAIVAAGVTLGVELSHDSSGAGADAIVLLPKTFDQPGFSDGPLRSQQQVVVAAARRRTAVHVAGSDGTVVYVVVRCDRGTTTVRLGGLTATTACKGHPTGVVRLTLASPGPTLQVTVDQPQPTYWTIGIYT